MNFLYFLGADIFPVTEGNTAIDVIATFLNENLIPFTIALCVLGAIVAIVLAAAMVKETDSSKIADYKKKMMGMVVTIFIIIGLVWILGWIITNLPNIQKTFEEVISF
ncbi:MAG: hypothetical protein EOM55_02150 [Clostridia bacterium]|nr:hypothetical protein [Clostridia bacterium]